MHIFFYILISVIVLIAMFPLVSIILCKLNNKPFCSANSSDKPNNSAASQPSTTNKSSTRSTTNKRRPIHIFSKTSLLTKKQRKKTKSSNRKSNRPVQQTTNINNSPQENVLQNINQSSTLRPLPPLNSPPRDKDGNKLTRPSRFR